MLLSTLSLTFCDGSLDVRKLITGVKLYRVYCYLYVMNGRKNTANVLKCSFHVELTPIYQRWCYIELKMKSLFAKFAF